MPRVSKAPAREVAPIVGAYPEQDRKLQLAVEHLGSRRVTKYDTDLALQICELIAEGFTLTEICNDTDHFPHKTTFNRWCVNNPDLRKAYLSARELSAFALEDHAINLAREIIENPGSAQRVRAFDIAMNQMRWSASKRNPREYGERSSTNVIVPIQINTGLDLGQGGSHPGVSDDSVYAIKAQVTVPTPSLMDPQPGDPQLLRKNPAHRPVGSKNRAQEQKVEDAVEVPDETNMAVR